jgi:TetR/AcrR family transcriptional repressor of nem operon
MNLSSIMARPIQFDRELALDLAVDTFWESGFEATSIEKLCRNLKLNPGSLYGAYGDKRTLFVAILDRYVEKVSREAIERIAGSPSGIAGIHAYFDFLIEAILGGKRRWGCLITNSLIELAAREPEIASKVELHFARLETAFASALARARAAGELKPGVGPEIAPYLVCVVQGLNVLARTKPTRGQLRGIIDVALDQIGVDPSAKLVTSRRTGA